MSESQTCDDEIVKGITKPSLQRLARIAGVKTQSADCVDILRSLLADETETLCKAMLVFNAQRQTKTIMLDDLYAALNEKGCKLAKSEGIGDSICAAK